MVINTEVLSDRREAPAAELGEDALLGVVRMLAARAMARDGLGERLPAWSAVESAHRDDENDTPITNPVMHDPSSVRLMDARRSHTTPSAPRGAPWRSHGEAHLVAERFYAVEEQSIWNIERARDILRHSGALVSLGDSLLNNVPLLRFPPHCIPETQQTLDWGGA